MQVRWKCRECNQNCVNCISESRCLCGHRLRQHNAGAAGGKGWHCDERGCKCGQFNYIFGQGALLLRCRCKHKAIEHEAGPGEHPCKNARCDCTKYDSPFICNCDHPYSSHFLEFTERRIPRAPGVAGAVAEMLSAASMGPLGRSGPDAMRGPRNCFAPDREGMPRRMLPSSGAGAGSASGGSRGAGGGIGRGPDKRPTASIDRDAAVRARVRAKGDRSREGLRAMIRSRREQAAGPKGRSGSGSGAVGSAAALDAASSTAEQSASGPAAGSSSSQIGAISGGAAGPRDGGDPGAGLSHRAGMAVGSQIPGAYFEAAEDDEL